MGCGSEKALKSNVPNSHPGLLLRTPEYSGETEFNREGRMQGQINTDLNQTGKDQAARAGKRLKNETYDKVRGQVLFLPFKGHLTL